MMAFSGALLAKGTGTHAQPVLESRKGEDERTSECYCFGGRGRRHRGVVLGLRTSPMKLLCLLSLLYTAYPSQGITPAVWYVSQSEQFQFVYVQGGIIEDAPVTVRSQSLCECRNQCMMLTDCAVASFLDLGAQSECRLSKTNLASTQVGPHHNASLLIWKKSPDTNHWIGRDGRAYLWLPQQVLVSEAKTFCSRIPGFRLGVYTSPASYEVLMNFYNIDKTDVAIDLNLVDSTPTWADGTTFQETRAFISLPINGMLQPFYTLSGGAFNDRDGTRKARVLCQADLVNGKAP
ncbi:uncharacterized protein LOC125028346 [Penaeus chinensis]|uniref:uncharacterized protein LOC125028346 n=1 Tax=Penaeus chinensis TaxID=139456 RepID=UPI001FB5F96E|nr:uncharacterized protein LOC125028346 [Penaeus chinensis]